MISCREASRMLSDAAERRLGLMERLRLRLHLAACGMCRAYAGNLRILAAALKRLQHRPIGAGPGLSEAERAEMLARLRMRIEAEQP